MTRRSRVYRSEMTPRIEVLELPASVESVARARDAVAVIVSALDWLTNRQIDDVRLMVSEAVTNSIEAHRGASLDNAGGHRVVVRCEVDDAQVVVSVTDTAGGFRAPTEMPQVPDPDISRERGLGLPLMAVMADEVRFESGDEGTVVRLVVRRST